MRRLLPVFIASVALLAACGDGAKSANTGPTTPATGASTDATNVLSLGGDTTSAPTVTLSPECLAATTTTAPVPTFPEGKPEVEIPKTLPTKLVITDLTEGVGPAAKAGDTVTVNYVGVRSEDGTEFDNSYDKGQTFPVTLGAGSVIDGWEQGLIGIKAGGRRQLDIPADLAYGDNPSGEIIQAGDALSFVIDAVSVVPGAPVSDPEDKPTVDIPKSVGAADVSFEDLVVGDDCQIAMAGQQASIQIIAYRGDTGEELQSTWDTGQPGVVGLDSGTVPGLVTGVTGMGVGGRRLVIIPPTLGFGAEGNPNIGLPADTDLILVVDLVALS